MIGWIDVENHSPSIERKHCNVAWYWEVISGCQLKLHLSCFLLSINQYAGEFLLQADSYFQGGNNHPYIYVDFIVGNHSKLGYWPLTLPQDWNDLDPWPFLPKGQPIRLLIEYLCKLPWMCHSQNDVLLMTLPFDSTDLNLSGKGDNTWTYNPI